MNILLRILAAVAVVLNMWATASAAGRAALAKKAFRYNFADSSRSSLVKGEQNPLIFPGGFGAVDDFEAKLEKVLRSHKGQINIWHMGDSHVQADCLTHAMRCHFADLTGVTGTRGILFPFSMAATNYGQDYRMSYTGSWSTSKNISANPSLPLGITGIAAVTTSRSASVSLNLNVRGSRVWRFNAMRVVCECNEADSVNLSLSDGQGQVWPLVREADGTYIVKGLPQLTRGTVTINNPKGARFILHGLEPLNDADGAINYYSNGINGASTASWLRCPRLESDLMRLKPDLVVLPLGVNDAVCPASKFDGAAFESRYRRIIEKVRKANPKVLLLFITNNDTYYSGRPNVNAATARDIMVKLAKDYNGCVWDCFDVMGGLGSSTRWRSAGYMARDLIHFSQSGYELLADLLFDALITDFIDNDK